MEKLDSKGITSIALVIAAVAVLASVGWIAYSTYNDNNEQQPSPVAGNQTANGTAASATVTKTKTFTCQNFTFRYPTNWHAWRDGNTLCYISNLTKKQLPGDLRAIQSPDQALVVNVQTGVKVSLEQYLKSRGDVNKIENFNFNSGSGYKAEVAAFASDSITVFFYKKGSTVVEMTPYPTSEEASGQLLAVIKSVK